MHSSAAALESPRVMRERSRDKNRRDKNRRDKDGDRHRERGRSQGRAESYIMGVPARFMRPRIVLFVACGLLLAFGLLMIYSSSSITALTDADTGNNAFYYVERQALYAGIGIALCVFLSVWDYHRWSGVLLKGIWLITVLALFVIIFTGLGQSAYGASRWISLGGFSFQPSEFAKITLLLCGAVIAQEWVCGVIDTRGAVIGLAVGVVVPLAEILAQPDKGTVMVIACTLIVMALLAGVDWRLCLGAFAAGFAGMVILSVSSSYSLARITTMLDPWQDEWGSGYQLIQGFYAFGSGGLTGVGLGFSRQKYAYLPMAYNDFIFAVVGEELGLVGTLGVLAGFAVLLWAGFQIARYAPDLSGRLIAAGSVTMLVIQLFLNVAGVIGIFPLSGKPIPFISYGGSSVISSLMLIGLCGSVSIHSKLPETLYERRRRDFSVTRAPRGQSTGTSTGGLRLHEGGLSSQRSQQDVRTRQSSPRSSTQQGRLVTDAASGHRRLDLGPSAAQRLRGRSTGPRVRTTGAGSGLREGTDLGGRHGR